MENIDVAIIGGGPAGLQAALVLARTRKRVTVFESPAPPRNHASHGVHNFLGLDGMLPAEIRSRAWTQIDVYDSAECVAEAVTSIERHHDSGDLVVTTGARSVRAREVILALGYHDVVPDIDGFAECWGSTIIPCPFCDGYENRDRRWAIVPSMGMEIDVFPHMVQNWTADRLVIAPSRLEVSAEQRNLLTHLDVELIVGDIVAVHHVDGQASGVTLTDGTLVEVGTLLWTPPEAPSPLIERLVGDLGLDVDDDGFVNADDSQRTNVDRLWAAGDVHSIFSGAIAAANAGGIAASMIVHGWFDEGAHR